MSKVLEKLKDVLNEEDLKKFEEAINKMVSEQVDKRVKYESKLKIDELNEMSKKYVDAEVEKKCKSLEEEKKEELKIFESKMLDTLDKFLENEIEDNISDELINKIAINETCLPIIESIKEIFESKHVNIDSDGHGLLKDAKAEIEELQEKNNKLVESKIEISTEKDKFESQLIINEKCEGLSDVQIEEVKKMFINEGLIAINSKIDDFIEIVIKKESGIDDTKDKLNESKDESKEDKDILYDDGLDLDKDKKLNEDKDDKDESSLINNSLIAGAMGYLE